jgi:hypothetical protein
MINCRSKTILKENHMPESSWFITIIRVCCGRDKLVELLNFKANVIPFQKLKKRQIIV